MLSGIGPREPLHLKYALQLLYSFKDIIKASHTTAVNRIDKVQTSPDCQSCHNVGSKVPSADEQAELWVLGDTHGQLNDVLWLFHEHGPPSSTRTYLFNGDIADRGDNAVEILLLLCAYKLVWPESVYINRGNHEARDMNEMFGFSVSHNSLYSTLHHECMHRVKCAESTKERGFLNCSKISLICCQLIQNTCK